MFRNVLGALLPNAPNLQQVCLQTGGKHYIGPFSQLTGTIDIPDLHFREDMPRWPVANFYYTLEDILFETVKKKEGLTWSVHRPAVIFGFSPWSLMNMVGSLAVYATICKHEGLPFRYPGNQVTWDNFSNVSDALLIAEQEIWAAVEPKAKNQAFNTTNGDVFLHKRIWSLLADKFGLEVPPYTGEAFSLQELMKFHHTPFLHHPHLPGAKIDDCLFRLRRFFIPEKGNLSKMSYDVCILTQLTMSTLIL